MYKSIQIVLLVYASVVKPGILFGLSTMSATFGSQITLHCNICSTDNVTEVFWERSTKNGNITLSNGLSGTSGSSPETPSLTILVASILDSGFYTCNMISFNQTMQGNTIMLTVQGASPDVQIESMSILGIHGNPLTLHVRVNATPLPFNLYWTQENKYGELITINSRATGYEGGNVSAPSLTINNPKFTENGKYTCFARNALGLGYSKHISLIVEGNVPLVSLDALRYNVSFGSTLSLNCTVTAFPNHTRIYWQRNQNDITTTLTQETEGITGVTTGTPTLTMTFVTISDEGSYTCFAENSVGVGSSRSALLTVTGGRPVVKIGSAMYSTIYGTQVTLECYVNGYPPSTIVYWEKKNKGGIWSILTPGTVGIEGIHVAQPSLTIIFPVNSDAGEYICVGVNDLGSSASLPTLLTVIGEKPLVSVNSDKKTARHGETYTLHCIVKATPVHMDVYWMLSRNGIVRKIISQTSGIRGVTKGNPSLTIGHVTISDEGFYTCYAVNIVGVGSSQSVFLLVEAAIPFVNAVIPSYSVKEGDGVSLLCKVSSRPEQTHVYWQKEKNGEFSILKEGTTGIIGATLDHPSLIFPNVGKTDSGFYICFATNAVGTGSSRAVFLEVKPMQEDTEKDDTFTENDQTRDDTSTWIIAICSPISLLCVIVATTIACYKCVKKESTRAVPSVEEENPSMNNCSPDSNHTNNNQTQNMTEPPDEPNVDRDKMQESTTEVASVDEPNPPVNIRLPASNDTNQVKTKNMTEFLKLLKDSDRKNLQKSASDVVSREEQIVSLNKNHPVSALFKKEVDLSTDKDQSFCDCIAFNNKLVFTDNINNRLVVFDDETSDKIYLPLQYKPWGITHVKNQYVAVSYPWVHIIHFIHISTRQTFEINTDSECWGISFFKIILYYVCCHMLKVINLETEMRSSIRLPSADICNVTVDAERFFCTDRDMLYCCDLQGSVIWKFKFQRLKGLHGVTVDKRGNAFVAGEWSNTIVSVSPDGKAGRVIGSSSTNRIKDPRGIYFDKDKDRLIVCNCNGNLAFVYDIKQSETENLMR